MRKCYNYNVLLIRGDAFSIRVGILAFFKPNSRNLAFFGLVWLQNFLLA